MDEKKCDEEEIERVAPQEIYVVVDQRVLREEPKVADDDTNQC